MRRWQFILYIIALLLLGNMAVVKIDHVMQERYERHLDEVEGVQE